MRIKLWGFGSRGFSLISVLVASVLLGLLFLALSRFGSVMNKQQLQTNSNFQINQISRQFLATIQNSTAWANTLNDPANSTVFACIVSPGTTPSCTGAGGAFQLNNSTGASGTSNPLIGYQSLLPTTGFTLSGTPCTGFVAPPAQGNDSCPLKLNLTWTANCPSSGSCTSAEVQLQLDGLWTYNPKSPERTIAFNGKNYNFQTFQNSGGFPTVVINCWNGAACDTDPHPQIISVGCPNGYFLTGCAPNCYDTNGIRLCEANFSSTSCATQCQSSMPAGANCNSMNMASVVCMRRD